MKRCKALYVMFILIFTAIFFCFNGPIQAKNLEWSGCIEADIFGSEQKSRAPEESESGIVLDTLEIVLDAELNENVSAMAIIKYDGGDDDKMILDEANVTMKNLSAAPVTLTVGKYVLPFGVFESPLVNDPITKDKYEINAAAVSFTYAPAEVQGLEVSFTLYDDPENEGVKDLTDYILNATMSQEELYSFTVCYNSAKAEGGYDRDDTLGVSLNAVTAQNVIIDAEYITALEREGDNPSKEYVYSLSADYQVLPALTLAARYEEVEDDNEGNQKTDEDDPVAGVDNRYSLGGTYELYENVALNAEYRISNLEAEYTLKEWILRLSMEF